MTHTQCFDILDLPAGASLEDIVSAYRQLALVWHPDRFSGNPDLQRKAQTKLAQINEAYSTLVDAKSAVPSDRSGRHQTRNGRHTPASPEPPLDFFNDPMGVAFVVAFAVVAWAIFMRSVGVM